MIIRGSSNKNFQANLRDGIEKTYVMGKQKEKPKPSAFRRGRAENIPYNAISSNSASNIVHAFSMPSE